MKQLNEMTLEELWQLFPIYLTAHNDGWKQQYRAEEKRLKKALGPLYIVRINHIGSTYIDGIMAKPIVDILLEAPYFADLQLYKDAIIKAGYILMASDEKSADFNKGYTPEGFADKVYHLHLRFAGDNDELYFRDYLTDNPAVAKDYEEIKLGLWHKFEHNRDAYTFGKTEFIKKYTEIARREYAGRYDCNGCGGCRYNGVPYEKQLAEKDSHVRSLFDTDVYSGISASPEISAYRNKMEYTFGNECKGAPMTLGMHQKGSFISVVSAAECRLVSEDFNTIVKAVLEFCRERKYSFYHKKMHTGFLRNLILRRGVRTGELLVNIVTQQDGEEKFDETAFIELLENLTLKDRICGILRTINNNPADALTVDELRVLKGVPYYTEQVMGLSFKVGAFSFFQTNVPAAERLYKEALELIPDISGKTVYDLFCGTGTITQAMALKAKHAIGVEIVSEAVDAARENAALNGLDNCTFLCGDVGEVLDSIDEQPDVIVVDPPRSGISPKTLNKILSYGVPEILYISCNPDSLAENLRQASIGGYEPVVIKAYDNFPCTSHVESVVLLTKVHN